MHVLEQLGGETWFALGDGDVALHLERTRRLGLGEPLSSVMADFARRLGVAARILPMSDTPRPTLVTTAAGEIGFQDYFVRQRCAPGVLGLRFGDQRGGGPAPAVTEALADPELASIIIAPSNPWLSIDPIFALADMKRMVKASGAPVIAVTPIMGGEAVKGPTVKIMRELGITVSPVSIADHYGDLIDGFILDERDAHLAGDFGVSIHIADTLMRDLPDRRRVARAALTMCAQLSRRAGP
jgi:LPPG:FO 2-phospho-L-lactate transferase